MSSDRSEPTPVPPRNAAKGALGPLSCTVAVPHLPSADDKVTACNGGPAKEAVHTKTSRTSATERDPGPEANDENDGERNVSDTWRLYKGLAYSMLSSFFFSACTVIVKMLKYFPAAELAVVRFLGILVFTAPLVMASGKNPFGTKGMRTLLVLRGLLGASSLFLRFYAIHYMPIADASVIIFSVPVFVSALARIFLKEPCSVFHVVTVLVTVVGLVLITKLPLLFGGSPDTRSPLHTRGLVAALSSTVFGASVYIVLRKLEKVHHSVIMFNFAWVAILETGAISLLTTDLVLPRTVFDGVLLFALGAFSFCGQFLLTRALQLEHAGPVSMVRSCVDIVLVFAWQVAFFGEVPDAYTVSGAVLVTACVLFTGLRKWIVTLPEDSVTWARMRWLLR